jgi:hypothetical protein
MITISNSTEPEKLVEEWLALDGPGDVPYAVGGKRNQAEADCDFTIKWPSTIKYKGKTLTVRQNVHVRASAVQGYALGGIWVQDVDDSGRNWDTDLKPPFGHSSDKEIVEIVEKIKADTNHFANIQAGTQNF